MLLTLHALVEMKGTDWYPNFLPFACLPARVALLSDYSLMSSAFQIISCPSLIWLWICCFSYLDVLSIWASFFSNIEAFTLNFAVEITKTKAVWFGSDEQRSTVVEFYISVEFEINKSFSKLLLTWTIQVLLLCLPRDAVILVKSDNWQLFSA